VGIDDEKTTTRHWEGKRAASLLHAKRRL